MCPQWISKVQFKRLQSEHAVLKPSAHQSAPVDPIRKVSAQRG
jgi:hypothetical protein